MLNFNDSTLVKLKIKDTEFEANKKIDMEKLKFYNSRYNKHNLSDYILVNKKPRKEKKINK
jgi:hypothetical protein